MNGVSDITFQRPLSTQDIHICRIFIAGKKEKREGGKERRKRRKEGMKYVAVRMTLSCSMVSNTISMHTAQ